MGEATKNDELEPFAAALGVLSLLGEDLGTRCQHRGGKDRSSPGQSCIVTGTVNPIPSCHPGWISGPLGLHCT